VISLFLAFIYSLPVYMTDTKTELATIIESSSNILVLVGAGVSVNAGIPDFRSPGSGLYTQFEAEDVSSIDSFRYDPTPFYTMVSNLLFDEVGARKKFSPTRTHRFLKTLKEKRKLLRVYSQNIDGLEVEAGLVKGTDLIQCHGSLDTIHCSQCSRGSAEVTPDDWFGAASEKIRLNSGSPSSNFLTCKHCGGHLEPCVVLFGESLPKNISTCLAKDVAVCDLLLVLGTSLSVYPFAAIPRMVPKSVPRFLLTKVPGQQQSMRLCEGDCDEIISELIKYLNW
jgi:NAD-dependent SIR2 family protein deacetylase